MLWMLACAPAETVVVDWPAGGCVSEGQPVRGTTPVREGQIEVNGVAVRTLAPRVEGCWPALVLVPPGLEEGLSRLEESEEVARAGVVVVAFDPPGRGESPGDEDHGGPTQQDALAAVLAWTADREDVDPQRVVVQSRSLGLALAAGALGRHPVAPRALFDVEGPVRLPEDLEHAPERNLETLEAVAEGEAWWEERSPSTYMAGLDLHYRRLQAADDHATGAWLGHAQTALNLAAEGAADPVDLNGVERESWTYEQVEADALEGRVKHDDERSVELLLGLF